MKLHLSSNNISISTSFDVHICLQHIWLTWSCAKKLNVYFIMVSRMVLVIWKLQKKKRNKNITFKETYLIFNINLSEIL